MPRTETRRTTTHALLLAAVMSTGAVAGAAAAAAPTATIETGPVTGKAAEGMQEFLGIRYAAPPVGVQRWMPPQPVAAAMATRTATAFGPHCAQAPSGFGIASTTEDCLFLNVYAPATQSAAAALPVMVWFHGGSLLFGESNDFDPVKLVVPNNVVVVTVNYRLGYLGFLAEAGLDAEGHPAGNYGLLDQQAALGWVKRNIAGFGGDPARVTIFGESAGGLSVLSNLASPGASGLFSRAIVESGGYALTLPTLAQGESTGAALAAALHCTVSDTACLRSASVQAVLKAQAATNIDTIVDGTILPRSINTALRTGQFNRVPLINGSNHDEYRLLLGAAAGLTAAQYPGAVSSLFSFLPAATRTQIVQSYPVNSFPQPVLTLAAPATDFLYACSARQIDRWVSPFVATWAYEFNDPNPPEGYLRNAGYPYGAAHTTEIQFLLTVPTLPGTPALSAAENTLSATMARYWTNFAAAASPNGGNVPSWTSYQSGADTIQSLAPTQPVPETGFATAHQCAFWNPLLDPS